MRVFPLVALWVALTATGFSQARTTLAVDTSNMRVTVSLDRQTYLPGEVAEVTLEVTNPASVPVTTLLPFISDTGCLTFRWVLNGRMGGKMSVNCVYATVTPSNTTRFAPGETKKLVLKSYDSIFDVGERVMEGGAVPEKSGDYGITYWYGTTMATALDTVAATQLEAEAIVALPPSTPYVHVVALRSGGVSYICVPQAKVGQSHAIASKEVMATKPSFEHMYVMTILATPLKRVATVNNPVVGLSATGDAGGNLSIKWTDSTCNEGQFYCPASYPVSDHKK
jgi:hypothetical protein